MGILNKESVFSQCPQKVVNNFEAKNSNYPSSSTNLLSGIDGIGGNFRLANSLSQPMYQKSL